MATRPAAPSNATVLAFALVVVAAISAVATLEVTGHDSGPLVVFLGVLLPTVVGALGLSAKIDRVEGKVNGQMDKARDGARTAGYTEGYLHALNGEAPRLGAMRVDKLAPDATAPPAAAPGSRGASRPARQPKGGS